MIATDGKFDRVDALLWALMLGGFAVVFFSNGGC